MGGPRAMTVRRTLPQRARSLLGAWCFLDHYGPDDVADTGGMVVAPHPHTGLQTVSWLFTGEVEHRDSAGHHALVRPGELNLMTAGHGISHSEVSTPETTVLHGAQLWVALPEGARDGAPGFAHHRPEPVRGDGWELRVFLGSLAGSTSPVPTATPLLGAELLLEPGARVDLAVDPTFELGVLVDTGDVGLRLGEGGDELRVPAHALACAEPGATTLVLTAHDAPARLLLLGGPPFGEPIVMWWNFVGRSHEEVVAAREAWQAQVLADADDEVVGAHPPREAAGGLEVAAGGDPGDPADPAVVPDGRQVRPGRFGVVAGQPLPPIPAPPLPRVRLRERR
nr:pirin family protein [Nocardioides perillae]